MKLTLGNNILISIMITTAIVGYDIQHDIKTEVKASEPTPTPVSTPVPSPEPKLDLSTPKDYIRYVFGEEDAKKAFLLLQGDGTPGACAENRNLDPKAVNDNRVWGGKGRDRGIFQISDYYHPTMTDEKAFDFKQNIDYAYRMFKNDKGSFKRWTCGVYYGI